MRTDEAALAAGLQEKPGLPSAGRSEAAALARATTQKLLAYCQANNWAGYDPYDALNSRWLKVLPFLDFKWPRLVLTQVMKRSPVNLRPLWLVPKTQNPKGLALFLAAAVKLGRLGMIEGEKLALDLAEGLLGFRSANTPYWCWGYNFDWQGRSQLTPRGLPNIICTSFAGNALLDADRVLPKPLFMEIAASAAEFVLNELYHEGTGGLACFSYTPQVRDQIHNANLLGAAFLCRVAKETGEQRFIRPALKAARFSVQKQRADGSWDYGELPTQRWIDNFHTGFNLCALRAIGQDAGTSEFDPALARGFRFYREHFFLPDGSPKYYHNRIYPLDIHSAAQSLITLAALRDLDQHNLELCCLVFQWAMQNLWSGNGFFYYQKLPHYTNRIPYMRWGQAWMLLGLAAFWETLERGPF